MQRGVFYILFIESLFVTIHHAKWCFYLFIRPFFAIIHHAKGFLLGHSLSLFVAEAFDFFSLVMRPHPTSPTVWDDLFKVDFDEWLFKNILPSLTYVCIYA